MGTVTIPSGGPIYFDANCIIYFVERIDPYYQLLVPVWEASTRGAAQIVTSEVTILEVLVRPLRERLAFVEQAFRGVLFDSRELHLLPATRATFERAAQLRADHALKAVDSIHAASALEANAQLVLTNDADFKKVAGLPVSLLNTLS